MGAIDPRTGPYAHYNRMSFTSYGFDKMSQQLWATMPRLLCRNVRDAAIRAIETDFNDIRSLQETLRRRHCLTAIVVRWW